MKIDIAGGNEPRAGFTNVDRYVTDGIIANCMELPFPSDSIESVNTSHYLEHLGKHQVIPQLKEINRVLMYGGLLRIEVPSLEWCCKNWLEHLDAGWNMDALFGDQSTPGQFHKTGFTRQIMYDYLGMAGFHCEVRSTDIWSHNQVSLVFEMVK